MKTIANILSKAKLGDKLTAGKLMWLVVSVDFDGLTIAVPANKNTKCELWSKGLESIAVIPDLKIKSM
jgi:hypothetical protein